MAENPRRPSTRTSGAKPRFQPLARHTMVKPAPRAWAALVASRPDLAGEPLLAGWAEAGYPLVARRPANGEEAGPVALGLPLPPAMGKRRIAITLMSDEIADSARPPLLCDAAGAAPVPWQVTIAALLRLDPDTRCFGSLAWQHLTGLAYVSAGSDLDLLWELPPPEMLGRLLEGIAAIESSAPMRIDGEVLGESGGANWRELLASEEILVKGRIEARLMPRKQFLMGERG